jgi:hypothetical protein
VRLKNAKIEESRLSAAFPGGFDKLQSGDRNSAGNMQLQLGQSQAPIVTTASIFTTQDYGASTITDKPLKKGPAVADSSMSQASTKGRGSTGPKVKSTSTYSCNLI